MALAALLCGPSAVAGGDDAPPARELLLGLTRTSRLAGTSGSLTGAEFVMGQLVAAGFQVELDQREVLLSLPRRIEFSVHANNFDDTPLVSHIESFDPDLDPPGDVPKYNAWSASGSVRAPVVDAGWGTRADFERLRAQRVDVRGTVALMRYGHCYRGVKVDLATQYGCSAVLLFSDPAEDGPDKGPTWPAGPWKPDWDAQRGSISPIGHAPGDPSTPGWASPRPGEHNVPRLSAKELELALPRIPCLPIGSRDAKLILSKLASVSSQDADGKSKSAPIGPGPVQVRLVLDVPRDVRTIHSVIARLPGASPRTVIAGNHRDAWVRGAHDAGSGTVSLLRAAQLLGAKAKSGWKPKNTITLCFWDAEEFGLIGSTEWGEANGAWLAENTLAYINADTGVSGTRFEGVAGSPGLLGVLKSVLTRIPAAKRTAGQTPANLWEEWKTSSKEPEPRLGLPGSGSDFAVFCHHLNLPVIDFGLSGSEGGQYHTTFDDFAMVERYIDPGFVGHELAGHFLSELLSEIADRGPATFDAGEAAHEFALRAREAGKEGSAPDPKTADAKIAAWLGAARGEQLALAFDALAAAIRAHPARRVPFYAALAEQQGIAGREWFKNRLWSPMLENGYGSETFPTLRMAATKSAGELDTELASFVLAIEALRTQAEE